MEHSDAHAAGRRQRSGDGDDPEAAEVLARCGEDLAGAVEQALPGWVLRSVEARLVAYRGVMAPAERESAVLAGHLAREQVGGRLRALLVTDIDLQAVSPLAVIRGGVRFPTAVLRDAGVPAVERDPFAQRRFPDDCYDLSPASFADLDPAVHEPGLRWGAAKAFVHLARRRRDAQR